MRPQRTSNTNLEEEKQDLDKKLSEVEAEKSRLLSRILDWEKYTAKLEPRVIDAEEKVAEPTVLTEDSDAVIANLRALDETLYEMLDRYGNAKVSAEILQNLIDLLKKDSAEGRYVKEAFCDSVSLTGCVQISSSFGRLLMFALTGYHFAEHF